MNKMIFLFLILSTISYTQASNIGVIVKKQGQVQLLSGPTKIMSKRKNSVLYQGYYYQLKKAKRGSKIKNGDILKTLNKSKVKVVYKNGDQFNIGENTAYKISWSKASASQKKGSTVNLIYGSIRGIISPKGPRKNLKVQSRTSVMGVRGTDFSFSQQGTSGGSTITVLRGKVKVAETQRPKKSIQLRSGFSAEIRPMAKKKKLTLTHQRMIEVTRTTKSTIKAIQDNSHITVKPSLELSPKLAKELKQLEAKALETTLEDIKNYKPKLSQKMSQLKITSVDELNKLITEKAYKEAPVKKEKIDIDQLNLDEDAYQKYFSN